MKVEGVEIPAAAIDYALRQMRADTRISFTAQEVEAWLRVGGCPEMSSYRATDRLFQRERQQGRISFHKSFWIWHKKEFA